MKIKGSIYYCYFRWKSESIHLGEVTEPFRIKFEASRGGDSGFIALDDIRLENCDPCKASLTLSLSNHSANRQ